MKNYLSIAASIAKELLKNPFTIENRMHWRPALAWFWRPSTVIGFSAANLYIIASYLSHRSFVLWVYKVWEHYDGVRSGTGFLNNHIAITQGALFTLIPLGILYLAFTGLASDNCLTQLRSWSIKTLVAHLRPWLISSLFWVL